MGIYTNIWIYIYIHIFFKPPSFGFVWQCWRKTNTQIQGEHQLIMIFHVRLAGLKGMSHFQTHPMDSEGGIWTIKKTFKKTICITSSCVGPGSALKCELGEYPKAPRLDILGFDVLLGFYVWLSPSWFAAGLQLKRDKGDHCPKEKCFSPLTWKKGI